MPSEGAVSLMRTALSTIELSLSDGTLPHKQLPLGQRGRAALFVGLSIDQVSFLIEALWTLA